LQTLEQERPLVLVLLRFSLSHRSDLPRGFAREEIVAGFDHRLCLACGSSLL